MFPDFVRIMQLYEAKREAFNAFTRLLLYYNERFNLTAITDERDILYKHYVDSLAGEALFPQRANVAEVGSGAGFPSIPLMIVRNDLRFTLIESTGKKCAFLREAVKELSLNAEVYNTRAEEAGRGSLRETFDVCCARAVAPLNTLAEYCLPLVKTGGSMIAYKGGDESGQARRAVSLLGGGKIATYFYSLPEGYGDRTLSAVTKERATPAKYPRGNGAERRSPL